jgi:MYXO-CTERM domain-containing protein
LVGYGWSPGVSQATISTLDAVYQVEPIFEHGIPRVDVGPLNLRGPITLFATANEPNAMSVTADFTIEDVADTTPPTFSGIESLSFEYMESMPGLCWPGGFGVRASFTPAQDDWAPTFYRLFEILPDDALQWVNSGVHVDARSLGLIHYAGYDEVNRCYVAIATDVGGNDAPPTAPICIDLAREGSDAGVEDAAQPDATIDDTGTTVDTGVRDTGVRPDAGTVDTGTGGELELDEEGGCGCSSTRHGSSTASLLLLGLSLVVLYRRAMRG